MFLFVFRAILLQLFLLFLNSCISSLILSRILTSCLDGIRHGSQLVLKLLFELIQLLLLVSVLYQHTLRCISISIVNHPRAILRQQIPLGLVE